MFRLIQIIVVLQITPRAALAQEQADTVHVLSTLDWWVMVVGLLTGALISLFWVIRSKALQTLPESAKSSETAASIEVTDPLPSPGRRRLEIYSFIGLALGLSLALAPQFPYVCTFGTVAIILFCLALPLFGIFQFGDGKGFFINWVRDRTLAVIVMLVSATVALAVINSLFEVRLIGSELQLVAGILAAIAIGFIGADLFFRWFGTNSFAGDEGNKVGRLAGGAMVALSIFVASQIPQVPAMFLWAVYLIVVAVYCGATTKVSQPANGHQQLLKGAGLVIMIFGVVGLVSASFGFRNFSQPFTQVSTLIATGGSIPTQQITNSSTEVFTYAKSMDEFERILGDARQENKPVAIDFFADWCLDCKRMERTTLKDPTIVTALTETFASIKIDVTDPNEQFSREIRKRYKVFGPPALLFLDRLGNLTSFSPTYGYLDVDELTDLLAKVQ